MCQQHYGAVRIAPPTQEKIPGKGGKKKKNMSDTANDTAPCRRVYLRGEFKRNQTRDSTKAASESGAGKRESDPASARRSAEDHLSRL